MAQWMAPLTRAVDVTGNRVGYRVEGAMDGAPTRFVDVTGNRVGYRVEGAMDGAPTRAVDVTGNRVGLQGGGRNGWRPYASLLIGDEKLLLADLVKLLSIKSANQTWRG